MQIGFYTSTFNDRPIEEVLDFAKASGFDAVEIDVGGHIKSPDNVGKVVKAARDHGLRISSVALFGNQLDPDATKRQEIRKQTAAYVGAVAEAGVPILVVFPGRDQTASEEENYENFASHVNSMLSSAPSGALSIVIENWPGPRNDFIATTPGGWERLALHQGADRRTPKTQDKVSFPVARHGAIGCLRRTLADHDLGRDEGLASPARARPRHPQHAPGAQAGRQFAAQRASTLNEQRLIDGFMADAHGRVVREVHRQATGDLLRAPGVCPSPVLPWSVPTAFPGHDRAGNRSPARSHNDASQPFLDIGS